MTDSCGWGDGGSEERKLKTPRDSSETDNNRRAPEQKASRPVVIYTESPKPVHVEAQDFKEVVRCLTRKSRKRRAETDSAQEQSAAQLPHSFELSLSGKSQEASETSTAPQQLSSVDSNQTLQENMEDLVRDNPLPEPSSNRGLFSTAGLLEELLEPELPCRTVPYDSVGESGKEGPESKDNPDGD